MGSTTFWDALVLAFMGGILLNFMPCVFPILSLKVLSIAQYGARGRAVREGVLYAAGVAVSMAALSILLLVLRATGHFWGWGFQMQSPIVVTMLMHITFLVGLSFSGFFELSLGIGPSKYSVKPGSFQSFFTGVLSTMIGTPCAAPFMVSAVSFAILQPGFRSIIVFQVVGLGMSFPYLVFSCIPAMTRLFPQPGRWMEHLKQFLAFPMYVTSAWLLHILVKQKGVDVLLPTLCVVIVVTLGVWLVRLLSHAKRAAAVLMIGLSIFIISFSVYIDQWYITTGDRQLQLAYVEFSQEELDKLLSEGKSVFLAVGAEWCLTCKANERVITSEDIQAILRSNKVIYMRADWTHMDQSIAEYLHTAGNAGSIPFYVLYVHGQRVRELPQILDKEDLRKILTENLNPK